MLQSLFIKDFIIIDQLEVDFSPGFTSITGETGAGKSVFVGALSLLMGRRAETSLIRQGANKSIIEGVFTDLPAEAKRLILEFELESANSAECIIRREIAHNGRNRSFVNDTPVPLSTMEKIAEQLIDIHSQHRNLLLGNASYILSAVDKMLADKAPLLRYQEAYKRYKTAEKELHELRTQLQKASEEYDYCSFRYNEISQANPKEGEENTLEEEEKLLRYADQLKAGFLEASQWIDGREGNALSAIQESLRNLSSIAEHLPNIAEYIQRIESCSIELSDISADFMRRSDAIEADPQRLPEVEERLDLLQHLLEKYHCASTKELIELQEELLQKINLYQDGDHALHRAEEKCQQLKDVLDKEAKNLTEARHKATIAMEMQIKETLRSMDLPHAEVTFELQVASSPKQSGYDEINFLFASNSSLPQKPVSEIASGGEMSRLMLALKALLAQKESLPTILFDEIDTGISGRIADKMGQLLRKMGSTMQVIAITHLPQIAARGNYQKHIQKQLDDKGMPVTSLLSLSEEERVKEVASLLSGDTITQESLEAAKVLLRNND